jgi:hypothetical protein
LAIEALSVDCLSATSPSDFNHIIIWHVLIECQVIIRVKHVVFESLCQLAHQEFLLFFALEIKLNQLSLLSVA